MGEKGEGEGCIMVFWGWMPLVLPSQCCHQHILFTVTLNFDLLTPKSEMFVSVPKCINAVSLAKYSASQKNPPEDL